jgi:hypothetical protein
MQRHTPTTSLYNEQGQFIGYRCEHCNGLFTQSGEPSQAVIAKPRRPLRKDGRTKDPMVMNQQHVARIQAAAHA